MFVCHFAVLVIYMCFKDDVFCWKVPIARKFQFLCIQFEDFKVKKMGVQLEPG